MGIVIICEGKSDLNKIKAVNKDLIVFTTGGFSFGDEFLNSIKRLEENNQIVLMLDPDYAGEMIRKRLKQVLKKPFDIYMPKEKCQGIGKLGIEHASLDDIKKALDSVIDLNKNYNNITNYDLFTLALSGSSNSAILRDKIAHSLSFTQRSAKDFLKKINAISITYKQLKEMVKNV